MRVETEFIQRMYSNGGQPLIGFVGVSAAYRKRRPHPSVSVWCSFCVVYRGTAPSTTKLERRLNLGASSGIFTDHTFGSLSIRLFRCHQRTVQARTRPQWPVGGLPPRHPPWTRPVHPSWRSPQVWGVHLAGSSLFQTARLPLCRFPNNLETASGDRTKLRPVTTWGPLIPPSPVSRSGSPPPVRSIS